MEQMLNMRTYLHSEQTDNFSATIFDKEWNLKKNIQL